MDRDAASRDREALDDAAVKKSLGDLGVDIVGGTPEEFAAYIQGRNPEMDRDREGLRRHAGVMPVRS